ncbi:MAG: hypothetical protein SGJ19_29220 [Planctomycetia bacterium]|nr:hypothetical protein [Planctomycetia bacterium]
MQSKRCGNAGRREGSDVGVCSLSIPAGIGFENVLMQAVINFVA